MAPYDRWLKVLAVPLATLFLSACGAHWRALNSGPREPTTSRPAQHSPMVTRYQEEEYRPYREMGSGRITGQAFGRTRSGEVFTSAGLSVYLSPVTTHSREWWDRAVLRGDSLPDFDPRARSFVTRTVADGDGAYLFDHLPPGEYFVASWVTWSEPEGDGQVERKVCLGRTVRLSGGEEFDAVLEPVSAWGTAAGSGCLSPRSAWVPVTPDTTIDRARQ